MAIFRTVLIADDEPSIRHVLSLVLTDKGYDVRAVADGEEALRELSSRPYDVVISDVRMPKVDGMALLKAALGHWPEITFLVMSAYGSQGQAVGAGGARRPRRQHTQHREEPRRGRSSLLPQKRPEERIRLLRENKRLKEQRGV